MGGKRRRFFGRDNTVFDCQPGAKRVPTPTPAVVPTRRQCARRGALLGRGSRPGAHVGDALEQLHDACAEDLRTPTPSQAPRSARRVPRWTKMARARCTTRARGRLGDVVSWSAFHSLGQREDMRLVPFHLACENGHLAVVRLRRRGGPRPKRALDAAHVLLPRQRPRPGGVRVPGALARADDESSEGEPTPTAERPGAPMTRADAQRAGSHPGIAIDARAGAHARKQQKQTKPVVTTSS